MDKYTQETKNWLNDRFKLCDESGIYFAHQPIYGFRKGHSEQGILERYIRNNQIMKAISHLPLNSFLDVGGAEGFKAYIVKQLFGARVVNSDLSDEACKRAQEIFNIEATPADIHKLPFANEEFDVVLCSETLEHVSDFRQALSELLRVSKIALIITVPYEPRSVIEKNRLEEGQHAHIHNFDFKSFDFLSQEFGFKITCQGMINLTMRIPAALVEAMPKKLDKYPKTFRIDPTEFRKTGDVRLPRALVQIYNFFVPVFRVVFGKRAAATLIALDNFICRHVPLYTSLLFVILKQENVWTTIPKKRIAPKDILDFAVPFHNMRQS